MPIRRSVSASVPSNSAGVCSRPPCNASSRVRIAAAYGASAVVVSDHRGRQLDRCPASLDVLEEVVTAVGGRLEVYLDGGVRRGGDVVIALALGARGVLVGRPYLYALAAGGEDGVRRALELLSVEMRNAMTLLGTPDLGSVT